MTKNPQVQSQIKQILLFTDGFISQNPSFETEDCMIGASLSSLQDFSVESHYLTLTGIKDVSITDAQGNTNQAISSAYRLTVPGVIEDVIGTNSEQIITPTDNTYTIRFTSSGQPARIEGIRGVTNQLADASYLFRYDDLSVPAGAVAELKLVNDQVDSLKYDSDGDGIPDTVIPASRVVTNPQAEDLQPPTVSVNWGLNLYTRSVTVTAADLGSGVKRIYYRLPYNTNFGYTDGNWARFKVIKQGSSLGWRFDLVTEDNAGNRSDVVTYSLQ